MDRTEKLFIPSHSQFLRSLANKPITRIRKKNPFKGEKKSI